MADSLYVAPCPSNMTQLHESSHAKNTNFRWRIDQPHSGRTHDASSFFSSIATALAWARISLAFLTWAGDEETNIDQGLFDPFWDPLLITKY